MHLEGIFVYEGHCHVNVTRAKKREFSYSRFASEEVILDSLKCLRIPTYGLEVCFA